MMTQAQIDASIEALQPAPADETLDQIAVRAAHWLLGTIEDERPEIAVTRGLYARAIAGDMPSDEEWQSNIDALYDARARARTGDLARALARDLALARAISKLLGDRLTPIERLDAAILAAVESGAMGVSMSSWHCGTTHCRAGAAITLHPMGSGLERAFGSWLAGAVIYIASTGRVPDFYAGTEAALADMRRAAA